MKRLLIYHDRMGKTIYITLMVFLFLGFAIVSVFLYWSLQSVDVLDIKNKPIPVQEQSVKAGEAIILVVNYCKNLPIPGEVRWNIASTTQILLLPPYIERLEKGCSNHLLAPVLIPTGTKPGTYFIHYSVVYEINPIRTQVINFDSQKFHVE